MKVCKAQHLVETNHELAQVLSTRGLDSKNKDGRPSSNAERERKLARLKALQKDGTEGSSPVGVIQ
jgi:hypothetical protein